MAGRPRAASGRRFMTRTPAQEAAVAARGRLLVQLRAGRLHLHYVAAHGGYARWTAASGQLHPRSLCGTPACVVLGCGEHTNEAAVVE